ncbi:MAG: hypothetical protein NTZ16_16030, partial [Verrucomicrobia bacterium]|nr:hypothetical protein [Verrucomicrobiota bacterium]
MNGKTAAQITADAISGSTNATTLAGQAATYYTNAGNLTGSVPDATLPAALARTSGAATPFADGFLALRATSGTATTTLHGTATAGNVDFNLPATSGTVLTTGNLASITAVGTVLSGTWQGTAIAVTSGGTGATTAAGARTNLGAAGSGANSDITALASLSGTTTLNANNAVGLSIRAGGAQGATNLVEWRSSGGVTLLSAIDATGAFTGTASTAASANALRGVNVAAAAPTTAQVLRYNGATLAWTPSTLSVATDVGGVLAILNGGTGSASRNFVDLSSSETIAGTKTFSSTIGGNISGSAASFTGNLAGDVTGPQGTTVVGKLQGRTVSAAAPSDTQVLRYVAGSSSWTPVALSVALGTEVSGTLPLSKGGTGVAAPDAASALAALGGAARGANNDITSIAGLTTALSVGQGGTGAVTAPLALAALGGAAKGANNDITSIAGLTTALSVGQGGTGAVTAPLALAALGGAAKG